MKKRIRYLFLYFLAAALFILAAVFFFRRGDTLMGVVSSVLAVSMAGLGAVWIIPGDKTGSPEKQTEEPK